MYFYQPNAVLLNEQTFLSLKQLISDLVKRTSSGRVDRFLQVSLLASLKLLRTNLMALSMTKMTLANIMDPSDLQEFKTFSRDCLN